MLQFEKKLIATLLLFAAFATALSGCTKSATSGPDSGTPRIPSAQGPVIDAGSIQPGSATVVSLSNGGEIVLQNVGGTLFHEVEGTLSVDSFNSLSALFASAPASERNARIGREISKIFERLKGASAIPMHELDEVGYFTFLLPYTPELLSTLKSLRFDQGLYLNAVTVDRDSLKTAKSLTPASEGIDLAEVRTGTRHHSGLARIHAIDFVRMAEADIGGGAKVNGSSVLLGITDTGMTLNHPSFRSAIDGSNRVDYMRDFTREGRIYFNPTAQFEATAGAGADELVINAQIIVTPKVPAIPAGNLLTQITGLKVKVSSELKQILGTPGSGAKLGVLLEESMSSEAEPVDLNANGKADDKLFAILIPGATPEQDAIYLDATGTGDFRASPKLMNWNTSKSTMKIFAETIGFDLTEEKLPNSLDSSSPVVVRSASIVGFDPGNHGTHVAGIAAGSKTLANDSSDTLARGVAPESRILLNRVCANNSGCGATQGLADLAVRGGAQVINMSLGGLSPFNDGFGVQETLINRLSSIKNVLFVISAGNSGPGRQTIGSPSTARLSLSVGASATQSMIQRQYQTPGSTGTNGEEDFMLFFSSRGPTAAGGFKPNVAAPGTELSAIQLNSAPGFHAGLDVYWGTSMAAPTATGAYALLLDAIQKYNAAHPTSKLTTNAMTLREVLIETARPFDVNRFDPETGARSEGRYTWVDQGKGMVDLTAAWRKLFEVRDHTPPSSVTLAGQDVVLDYQVIAPAKNINGLAYDGTRAAVPTSQTTAGIPAIGTGIYLDAFGTDTARQVHIARRLPEALASGPDAGELTRQLVTTSDDFLLKTSIYGSALNWVKAGTLEQLDCAGSLTSNLTVISRGVDVAVKADGTAKIAPMGSSSLNVCMDRGMIAQLPPGDHGAIISAYRVVNGVVAPLPSFTVPVYVAIPHQTLADSASYESVKTAKSFEVSRNYVNVPAGTSLIKVTLEVPQLKLNARGLPLAGETCSGVELMGLQGNNSVKVIKERKDGRVANCTPEGAPVIGEKSGETTRKLVFSAMNPTPGIWDLHVLGSYKFTSSNYKLRVDYINSASNLASIEGDTSVLNGSFDWKVLNASLAVLPDSAASLYELDSLMAKTETRIAQGQHLVHPGVEGELRKYPAEAKSVSVRTGGSPGNDIDLVILECAENATTSADASCRPKASSGGSSDEELATFAPKADKRYAIRIDGYTVHGEGKFTLTESIKMPEELATVAVSGDAPDFSVSYSLSTEQIAASKLLQHALFTSGAYKVAGSIKIRSADKMVLSLIPIAIQH